MKMHYIPETLQLISKFNPFTNKAHKYNEIKHKL